MIPAGSWLDSAAEAARRRHNKLLKYIKLVNYNHYNILYAMKCYRLRKVRFVDVGEIYNIVLNINCMSKQQFT